MRPSVDSGLRCGLVKVNPDFLASPRGWVSQFERRHSPDSSLGSLTSGRTRQ